MKFETFKNIITTHKKINQLFHNLNNIGIDFIENVKFPIANQTEKLFNLTLTELITNPGIEWVDWFIYENDYGKNNLDAFDENHNKICYDLKSLYVYLKKNNYFT